MSFKSEEVIFHREEYLDQLIEMRPKDYAPLLKKEVVATADYRHRNPNPYTTNGKALVSFVVTETDVKSDVQKAVNLIGGLEKSLKTEDRILIKPDLIIMDGRISFVSGGPAIGQAVHPNIILASGDQIAMDVQGVRFLQNYAAVNHLTRNAWDLPQIKTAVKHNLGIKSEDEIKLIR
jgi:uncharacterized protein (DUF362 family)